MKNKRIRRATKADHAAILTVWMQSVSATHHFLDPMDFDTLYTQLCDLWLGGLEVIRVQETGGVITGFIGINPPKVEMLFVAPAFMGKGIGRALLDSVRKDWPGLFVDVNEQNEPACRFYRQ
ncbi:MAG: GNAT family N-acetyltransferase, partial [Oxalobacter sp.]|nr:GNAT family N-acetyltransferase [Oxalobacter sp.]